MSSGNTKSELNELDTQAKKDEQTGKEKMKKDKRLLSSDSHVCYHGEHQVAQRTRSRYRTPERHSPGSGGRVMSQSRKAPRSLDHLVPKQSPYFTVAEKTCGSLERFLK